MVRLKEPAFQLSIAIISKRNIIRRKLTRQMSNRLTYPLIHDGRSAKPCYQIVADAHLQLRTTIGGNSKSKKQQFWAYFTQNKYPYF